MDLDTQRHFLLMSCLNTLWISDFQRQFPSSLVRIPHGFGHSKAISTHVLSEYPLDLDFQRQFPSSLVRIPSGFGLPKGISFKSCPNTLWIRTSKVISTHVLSEYPLDSDFQRQFPSSLVRIPHGFGHSKAISFMSCPNTLWIRTSKGNFLQVLSEYPLDSDSKGNFYSCLVRIPSRFGLPKAISFKSCPNTPWIRTLKGNSYSCLVRIPSGFGLPKAISFMSCPNTPWIRTLKGNSYSCLVRIPHGFGHSKAISTLVQSEYPWISLVSLLYTILFTFLLC